MSANPNMAGHLTKATSSLGRYHSHQLVQYHLQCVTQSLIGRVFRRLSPFVHDRHYNHHQTNKVAFSMPTHSNSYPQNSEKDLDQCNESFLPSCKNHCIIFFFVADFAHRDQENNSNQETILLLKHLSPPLFLSNKLQAFHYLRQELCKALFGVSPQLQIASPLLLLV